MESHLLRRPSGRTIPIILALFLTLAASNVASADNPTVNVLVALAPIDRKSAVELVAITLDGNLSETDGHTIVQGKMTFKVHNTDSLEPVTVPVGFPEWAGGALTFDPSRFNSFVVSLDNKQLTLGQTTAPVMILNELRPVSWYSFDLTLDPDEKKVVDVDFVQDLGPDILPRFTIGLLPSNGWKGKIGSTRLSIILPSPTTADQFVTLDPTVPKFDGDKLTWLWIDFNPDADPSVTLIRPSMWADLLDKRAAAAQNPNDSAIHFALGRAYEQLAGIASPRRDNFLSQAVAELETAARLDPGNLDSATTLAELYETRAGPPSGPRDINYVALALAEWQTLIGSRADADARLHSAEDSFYLGIEARSRGENDQALKFLQDASNFSPKGAGPLFTIAHWTTEMEAVRIALAKAAEAQGQIATALSLARSALGKDFDLSPSPPFPSFAVDHAEILTTNAERRITFSVSAYPGPSADAEHEMDSAVSALNKTGVGTAARVVTESNYGLMITVPFNSDKDLISRLGEMARGFPAREDWKIMGGIVNAPAIEWNQTVDTFTRKSSYREDVDLASTMAPIQTDLDKLSQTIGALESASPGDDRAQLRLALMKDSQQWWQRALATGSVDYLLERGGTNPGRWSVKIGEKTTLLYDDSELRPEWYLIGATSALIAVLLILLLAAFMRAFRRRRLRPS